MYLAEQESRGAEVAFGIISIIVAIIGLIVVGLQIYWIYCIRYYAQQVAETVNNMYQRSLTRPVVQSKA